MDHIEALDEAIIRFRVASQHPAYQHRILAGLGLRGIASLRVLRSVERLVSSGDRATVGQVATAVGVEQSTASRSIESLVQDGLLAKHSSPDDRRCVLLELTDQGQSTLRAASEHRHQAFTEVVRDWSEQDVRSLTSLLGRLQESFEQEFQKP